ncbi:Exonuclease 1 [Diplonema papillatum]|nr:Exonuclease 1 [Diplonema papillatum]
MGIHRIRASIQESAEQVPLEKLRGKRVGIDTGVVYPFVANCATEFFQERAHCAYIEAVVSWCLKLKRKHNITVVVVFDGCHVPAKSDESEKRNRKRDIAKGKADAYWAAGNREKARKEYRAAFNLLSLHQKTIIDALKANGIDAITAPYEADSQESVTSMPS